nr:unnamed protein product [Digitaria exilis]
MPRRRASPDTASALHDQGAFRATEERRSGRGAARAGTERRAVELDPAVGGPYSSRLLASAARMETAAADAWSSHGAVPRGRQPSRKVSGGRMEPPPRRPARCSTPSPPSRHRGLRRRWRPRRPHLDSRSRRCGGAKVVSGSPCSLALLLEIEEARDGYQARLEA